jgi:predicted nucleic acid-binding protein
LIGWLLDTNVIASLIAPNGAPSVKAWAASQDESRLYLSVLTLAEYEKGIHNLADDHPDRPRHRATAAALGARFEGRVLPISDAVVLRWGQISGRVRRDVGAAPPVIDTLLAATAIEADLHLVTRNVRGVLDSGASVFSPWTDDPSAFPIKTGKRGG